MIVVVAAVAGALILAFAYAKSKAQPKSDDWFAQNAELDKFCAATDASAAQMQKQLLAAAAVTMGRIYELEDERYALYGLVNDQVLSPGLWRRWDRSMKELHLEKMVIASEADTLRDGWAQSIFKEASALATRARRAEQRDKKSADSLYNKKREMLEKKVLAKLTLGEASV